MKTLREMMDLVESAQTVDEGWFSKSPEERAKQEAIRDQKIMKDGLKWLDQMIETLKSKNKIDYDALDFLLEPDFLPIRVIDGMRQSGLLDDLHTEIIHWPKNAWGAQANTDIERSRRVLKLLNDLKAVMIQSYNQVQTQGPVEEGIKSALAGAALAGSLAMNPAQAQEPPSWQDQVVAAMKAGDIPQASNVKLTRQAGWVTSVTINGKTYDISHRIPQQGKQQLAQLRDVSSLMQNEETLNSIEEGAGAWLGGVIGAGLSAIPGLMLVVGGEPVIGATTMTLASALVAFLGHKGDEQFKKELTAFSTDNIYIPYVNGTALTKSPVDGITAGKMIATAAKQEHDSKTQYTIKNTKNNEIEWRFSVKGASGIMPDVLSKSGRTELDFASDSDNVKVDEASDDAIKRIEQLVQYK